MGILKKLKRKMRTFSLFFFLFEFTRAVDLKFIISSLDSETKHALAKQIPIKNILKLDNAIFEGMDEEKLKTIFKIDPKALKMWLTADYHYDFEEDREELIDVKKEMAKILRNLPNDQIEQIKEEHMEGVKSLVTNPFRGFKMNGGFGGFGGMHSGWFGGMH